MAKLTLQQKRLETLRRQLQGKDPAARAEKGAITRTHQPQPSAFTTTQSNFSYTTTNQTGQLSAQALASTNLFLKRDLFKVLTLSALAIAIELSLYFSLQHGLFVNLI